MADMTDAIRGATHDIAPARARERIERVVADTPPARHLLDLRVVGLAACIALAVALVIALLLSPKLAAVILVLGFFAAWAALAMRSYERRRRTDEAAEN